MRKLPKWISPVLKVAGILNFFLAAGLAFFSESILATISINPSQTQTGLWLQVAAIGFVVLGLGYLIASFNALRNSVALVMGLVANLLGMVLLPLHFGFAIFSKGFLLAGVASMLGWALLLLLMLYHISKAGRQAPQSLAHTNGEPLSRRLSRFRTQKGKSLLQLSNHKPVLVIFLPPFGPNFSRKVLADIKHKRASIEEEGTRLVFVHLEKEEKALEFFRKAGLEDEHRISDPNGIMYSAFGLDPATFAHIPVWHLWLSKVREMFSNGTIVLSAGEGMQMPGIFLINQGEIIKSYRHEKASERPDYVSLANGKAA